MTRPNPESKLRRTYAELAPSGASQQDLFRALSTAEPPARPKSHAGWYVASALAAAGAIAAFVAFRPAAPAAPAAVPGSPDAALPPVDVGVGVEGVVEIVDDEYQIEFRTEIPRDDANGQREALGAIRETLAQAAGHPLGRPAEGDSSRTLEVGMVPETLWRDVCWVVQQAAAPRVRVRRISLVLAGRGPVWIELPTDHGTAPVLDEDAVPELDEAPTEINLVAGTAAADTTVEIYISRDRISTIPGEAADDVLTSVESGLLAALGGPRERSGMDVAQIGVPPPGRSTVRARVAMLAIRAARAAGFEIRLVGMAEPRGDR